MQWLIAVVCVAVTALAAPGELLHTHAHHDLVRRDQFCTTPVPMDDFGLPTPVAMTPAGGAGWQGLVSQWCACVWQDLLGFDDQAPVAHVTLKAAEVMADPVAYAAMAEMKQQEVLTGSCDLPDASIDKVYGAAIRAAANVSNVPYDAIRYIVSNESKGHPLRTYGGLTQIGPAEFMAIVAAYPSGFGANYNCALPHDSIMAGALRMRQLRDSNVCTTWENCYYPKYCLGEQPDPRKKCLPQGCPWSWCTQG